MRHKINPNSGFAIAILIATAALCIIAFCGWRLYVALSQKQGETSSSTTETTSEDHRPASNENAFKLNDLGVQFEIKDNITPIYYGKVLSSSKADAYGLSTQQIVDEGAKEAADGKNTCAYEKTTSTGSYLTNLYIYSSTDDILEDVPYLSRSDVTTANGYFTIHDRIFYVRQVPISATTCTKTSAGRQLEKEQFESLRQSLMTLRSL